MQASAAKIRKTLVALTTLAAFVVVSLGATPAPSVLGSRLAQHATVLASASAGALPATADDAARYIETTLASLGYEVTRQSSTGQGQRRQQIEAVLSDGASGHAPSRVLIVGANHSPWARDLGSGVAAVIELARLLKSVQPPQGSEIRFVFFVRGIAEPGPPAGNFLAFSGGRAESERVRKALASFRAVSSFPDEGLAARAYVEGVTVSGTLMITDAEFLRYPYSHTAEAARRPDYDNMARVVDALARMLRRIAAPASM